MALEHRFKLGAPSLWRGCLSLLTLLLLCATAQADLFVVNSTSDAGDLDLLDDLCDTGVLIPDGTGQQVAECTLRAAIEQAEDDAARDQIEFSSDLLYDVWGYARISPATSLPAIDNPVDIDATTAPSWSAGGYPRVRVRLSGTGSFKGLHLRSGAADSTVKGLAFQGFTDGVHLDGTTDAHVDSCAFGYWLTVAPTLIESIDGNATGIRISEASTGSKIGQRVLLAGFPFLDPFFAGHGNVISGNTWGIRNEGEDTVILGNKIGSDISGQRARTLDPFSPVDLGNTYGIWVDNGSGLRIGRVIFPINAIFLASGNVVSGNDFGIYIDETSVFGGSPMTVVANQIGTDVDGEADRGNANWGIAVVRLQNDLQIGSALGGANIISGNDANGIEIRDGVLADITIEANRIGLGADDLTPIGNGGNGIHAEGGDPLTIARNLIGNSGEAGILIEEPQFSDIGPVTIEDNWIGTNPAGDPQPNVGNGITIEDTLVQILDNTVGESEIGIFLGESSADITVTGNFVGTNESGADLGNATAGIRSTSLGGGHQIGEAGNGNVVGWNGTNGITLNNALAISSVLANRVGLDSSGDPIPNERHGISIRNGEGSSNLGIVIGSSLNTVATDFDDRMNRIAFNVRDAISLETDSWAVIRANRIRENGDLAIDLNGDGSTANDTGDFDFGANRLQNHPELDAVGSFYDVVANELEVEYRVTSNDDPAAASNYDLTVDFYLADASGLQPRGWLGADVYPAAQANQQRTVRFVPSIPIPAGGSIVATATDDSWRTSEVGAPVVVPEPGMALGLAAGALGLGALGRRPRRSAAGALRRLRRD